MHAARESMKIGVEINNKIKPGHRELYLPLKAYLGEINIISPATTNNPNGMNINILLLFVYASI